MQEAQITDEKPDIWLRVDEKQSVVTLSTSPEKIAIALSKMSKTTLMQQLTASHHTGSHPIIHAKGYSMEYDMTPHQMSF
ncbi:hypothetical protein HPB48_015902 [Haemaphysalis longicornis]|uniref:Uncharacterized protein n=1 Tax=Haemaphysalis longicornis TaxID=44386 RepID=A0A9J6GDH2_HAELO|nr:hypothetical protein HPB48_015902 [Haemaphysalis longicornis]